VSVSSYALISGHREKGYRVREKENDLEGGVGRDRDKPKILVWVTTK
jgi:hypothetical protein